VDENTRLVYLESVGNPKNERAGFPGHRHEAHKHGLPVIVDNTVLTPALFRPFEHGIDIAVYSTTKFLGGHGVHIGGAIVDSGNFLWAENPKKWPEFTEPSESYHGVVFTEALKPLGNLSYILHIRTHCCATREAHKARLRRFCCCWASKPCTCAWNATCGTRRRWRSGCCSIPR